MNRRKKAQKAQRMKTDFEQEDAEATEILSVFSNE